MAKSINFAKIPRMSHLRGEKKYLQALLGLIISITLFSSCVNPKQLSYFNYVPDSTKSDPVVLPIVNYSDPVIQPNDVLQISVQTIDPQGANMMGTQQSASFGSQGAQGATVAPGYLVDKNGEIELPLVGRIKVGGMTTTEARNAIGTKASQYYKNPVVNVRFSNFVITVLGEVNRPGQYTVPNEKVTIYDALGMAGDLTIGGKRNDILLMREEGGEKKFVRVDLNSKDLFQSPYFYLRQHDVIYVGPTKSRAVAADAGTARTLSFVTIGLSIVTLVITVLRF